MSALPLDVDVRPTLRLNAAVLNRFSKSSIVREVFCKSLSQNRSFRGIKYVAVSLLIKTLLKMIDSSAAEDPNSKLLMVRKTSINTIDGQNYFSLTYLISIVALFCIIV